jgi:hypothetical protein
LIAARVNPTRQYDRFHSSSPEIPGKNEDEKNNLNLFTAPANPVESSAQPHFDRQFHKIEKEMGMTPSL